MGRKKAVNIKKGGNNYDIDGPLLSTKLYDKYNLGKLENIKKVYDEKLDKTRQELNRITTDLKNMQDVKHNEEERKIKVTEITNKKKIADDILSQKIREKRYNIIFKDFIGGFLGSIGTNLKSFVYTTGTATSDALKIAFNSGEGILFKIICLEFLR